MRKGLEEAVAAAPHGEDGVPTSEGKKKLENARNRRLGYGR